MRFIRDRRGVQAVSIILFGLLALSVVLLNAISITVNQRKHAAAMERSGETAAISFCGTAHSRFPEQCLVARAYQCGGTYILQSNCIGVGEVILDKNGDFLKWCGYATLDQTAPDCGRYWMDAQGRDCTATKNLCGTK
ncbi:MAG: hypothetical protein PHY34_04175 [Patescibacteria group bacterium]|nr:hypothetical protein [Patescibacteria group bacterium]MDD5715342.1 hypothetical protein [Patescibacteria group bacterium]